MPSFIHITVRALQDRINIAGERNQEFELIPEVPSTYPGSRAAGHPKAKASAGRSEPVPEGAARNQILKQIGLWIRRALAGNRRGLSGREKIPQANQYYLVVKDFSGRVHDPPLFFRAWSSAKPYCQQSGQFGDSIFVGLPSQAEVRIAVRAAGLDLPAALLRR